MDISLRDRLKIQSSNFFPRFVGVADGTALIYVMMVATFCAIAIAMTLHQLDVNLKEKKIFDRKDSQIQILNNILKEISQPSSLLASSASNPRLRNCIFAAGTCSDTDVARPAGQEFNAFSANRGATGLPVKKGGTAASPVLYDPHGKVCTAPNPVCLYSVQTFFRAKCPSGTSSCSLADEIEVRAMISQVPNTTLIAGMDKSYRLDDQPRRAGAVDTSFNIKTFTREITGTSFQVCSDGAVQTGVLPDGHIVCKCTPEYPQVSFNSTLQMPICLTTSKCPIGQQFRGLQGANDPKPGEPICVDPSYRCETNTGMANVTGRHTCTSPAQQIRATSQNPFVGCTVNYPSKNDHKNVRNGSLSCPSVRILCCEASYGAP